VNDIIDRAFAGAAADYEAGLRSLYDRLRQRLKVAPESKIEEALLIAAVGLDLQIHCFDFDLEPEPETFYAERIKTARPWLVRVFCQAPVLSYRADFLFEVVRGEEIVGRIVVECDGHDYHERTPDQAERDRSRDRKMTLAGYQVLRFTGREIYRDPSICMNEAFKAIIDIAVKTRPA
jgi:very-short-patch-repair endonuclease